MNALIFLILDGAAVGTLFLFAYLVVYVLAPHLAVYAMIGLFVVAVLAGIGLSGAGDDAGCGKTSRPVL